MSDAVSILDISDKDILAATRQVRGVNDSIVLKYELPSGRKVTSEAFRTDQGAKALIAWCEVIRGQMLADAQNERDAVRQKVMEEKAVRAEEAKSLLVDPRGHALDPALLAALPPRPMPTAGASAGLVVLADSPDAFIRNQIEAAREVLERIEWQVQEGMQSLVTARANVQKWEALALSLAPQVTSQPGLSSVVRTPKRRGRPKQVKETKNDGIDKSTT